MTDIYQSERINRATVVFEEAVKSLLAAYSSTEHGLKPLRAARDEMNNIVRGRFTIAFREELGRIK